MSICLALCQIDHANIVIGGLPAVNHALATGDLAPLRELIQALPFEESEELTAYLRDQLARLHEFDAPPMIIESAERRLARLSPPTADALHQASLDELRELLGGWCRDARTTDLDKAWDLLHWYGDAGRRTRADGNWRNQGNGFAPSALDFALHGREGYPLDTSGRPVIQTGGSPEMSWYNPPAVVARIAAALAQVSPDEWDEIDRTIDAVPERQQPYLADLEDRLDYAREEFDRLAHCYRTAAERGFGVSVEYY
jgi:hypothetical protein